jgi:SAM-dependent methyltransferase
VDRVSAYPSQNDKFRMAVVFYCRHCGTGSVPGADDLLSGYYESEYANSNRKDRSMDPAEYFHQEYPEPGYGRYFARAKTQIAALQKHSAVFNRVLDYGSGPGYLLFESKAKQPFAVELDGQSDKYLEYLGATKLDPNNLGTETMDVIVASHVVEHFTHTNLDINLGSMANALAPGGLLLIEVPQGGHSFSILDTKQDPHTFFFTPEGIYRSIERQGIEILDAYPRGVKEVPAHPKAIYTPAPDNAFFLTRKGGLTIIARKS